MKAGRKVNFEYFDGEQWQTVGHADADETITMKKIENESEKWQEWLEEHGTEWTMEVEIKDISFDETWLVAYHARMYAETFRS